MGNSLFMYVIQSSSDLFHPMTDFTDNESISCVPRDTFEVVKNAVL